MHQHGATTGATFKEAVMSNKTPFQKAEQARKSSLLLLLLVSLYITTESLIFRSPLLHWSAWLVLLTLKLVPLIAFTGAILYRKTKALAWMGFVVVFYIFVAAIQVFEPGHGGVMAIGRCLLATLLLVSISLQTRWQAQNETT